MKQTAIKPNFPLPLQLRQLVFDLLLVQLEKHRAFVTCFEGQSFEGMTLLKLFAFSLQSKLQPTCTNNINVHY